MEVSLSSVALPQCRGERGLLLAVKADALDLNGEGRGPVLVALSPTPVSDGGGYQALIGPM